MDVLSDVLSTLRLQGTVFASAELLPPWGMRAEARDHYAFHIVARGSCWLDVDDHPPTRVSGGDVVVLKRGRAHALRDSLETEPIAIEQMIASGAFSAPPRNLPNGTHLVCGGFTVDDLHGDVLLESLPTVIHTHELASEHGPWLAQTVKLLAYESSDAHPGARTVVSRLCDALFVYVIRSVLADLPRDEANWLRALVTPKIGEALRLIHAEPREPWTVAALASRVGMSRSAFAERFCRVVGQTPMQYLMRWRLQKAASLLRADEIAIAEIASAVGYESDAAFSKAFKRSMGIAPGAYRRGLSAAL